MKVLQVIHGYPMRYNAGSEVYTQGLVEALAERHEVHVFTRQENGFLPEYAIHREADPSDPRVTLHVINMARARDGYRHPPVDDAFASLLDQLRPDVVHIEHLNHLSLSVVTIGEIRRGITQQERGNEPCARELTVWLSRLPTLYGDHMLSLDVPAPQRWGRRSASLGYDSADLMIAATALGYGLTVVTRNVRHFEPTGIPVLNPFGEQEAPPA